MCVRITEMTTPRQCSMQPTGKSDCSCVSTPSRLSVIRYKLLASEPFQLCWSLTRSLGWQALRYRSCLLSQERSKHEYFPETSLFCIQPTAENSRMSIFSGNCNYGMSHEMACTKGQSVTSNGTARGLSHSGLSASKCAMPGPFGKIW